MPVWDGEEDDQANGVGQTPKQRLLNWINTKVPQARVNNFTSDWASGKAVGALVDACAPGLCPDWEMWNTKDALENASEAMGLADDWLDVRQLITPEEIISPNIDEQSMMTYLSQYPNAKLKEGAPVRPKSNIKNIKVYGPGVEPEGVVIGHTTSFVVETFTLAKGNLDVRVLNPHGQIEKANIIFNDDKTSSYTVSYTPKQEGLYRIHIKFYGNEVPGSPFDVRVGTLSKVMVSGPGIQNEVSLNKATYFDITAHDVARATPELVIVDTVTGKTVDLQAWKLKVREIKEGVWRCEYTPRHTSLGLHQVNVSYGGDVIKGSPFALKVVPNQDARKVRASGRGLQPKGVRVGDDANFKIYTDGAGDGEVVVNIMGPGGVVETAKVTKIDATTYEVHYFPTKEGRFIVLVTYDGQEIPKCPFEVAIGPYKESSIIAHGPGLSGGVVGYPACFVVETNGETGALGFTIAGPSQAEIECHDNGDGSALVKYHPTAAGEYAVHILCDDEDIPKSPFIALVHPSANFKPENVKVFGQVLQEKKTNLSEPTMFTIDTSQSGEASLEVKVQDVLGNVIPISVIENPDGTKSCTFTTVSDEPHTIEVNYGGVAVPNSPFRIYVEPKEEIVDVSKIKIVDLESIASMNTLQQFRIIDDNVERAECIVVVTSPTGNQVKAHVISTAEGYLVNFTPTLTGEYKINIYFGEYEITPALKVESRCPTDFHKVRVFGPGLSRGIVKQPAEFVIDTRGAGPGGLGVTVEGPCEAAINCRDNGDGTCNVAYLPTEIGEYVINILFNDHHIKGSPFTASIIPQPILNNVRVTGLGIQYLGVVQKVTTDFTVDLSALGEVDVRKLTCSIIDPTGNIVPTKVVREPLTGSYKIQYTPLEAGQHNVELLYDNIPINGTPFIVNVQTGCDPAKCKAYGPGLLNGVANKLSKFTVETKEAGTGGLSLAIEGPSEAKMTCTDNRDGSCDVEYLPTEPGEYDVTIRFAGKHIPGSPFKVVVEEGADPSKVQVYGPAIEYGQVKEGSPTFFEIDVLNAGSGKVAVKINSPDGKVLDTLKVEEVGNGVYRVHFVPPKQGTILEGTVTFADQPVPCSPFVITVFPKPDEKEVEIVHKKENAVYSASLPAEFQIQQRATDTHEVQVFVENPRGRFIKPKLEKKKNGIISVTFTPDDFGDYKIHVKRDGKQLNGSPFILTIVPIGDATKCKLPEIVPDTQLVGKKNKFKVDTKEAGEGAVTCEIVSEHGNEVDVEVVEKHRVYEVSYVLKEEGVYNVDLKYGGQSIPNGTFTIKATTKVEEISRITETRYTETKQQALETHITEQIEEQYTLHKKSEVKYRTVTLEKVPLPSTGGKVTVSVLASAIFPDKNVTSEDSILEFYNATE